MTALRRHVLSVVAALFALAVGIALGGGPLSYVPADDASSVSDGKITRGGLARPCGGRAGTGDATHGADGDRGFAERFVAVVRGKATRTSGRRANREWGDVAATGNGRGAAG